MTGNSNEGWTCSSCGTLNKNSISSCQGCGVSREWSIRQEEKKRPAKRSTFGLFSPMRKNQICLSPVEKIGIYVIIILLVVGLIMIAVPRENTGPRAFSSSERVRGTVYADIVSISPEYTVAHEYNGYSFDNSEDMVCRCKTTTGKTIWVRITYDDYWKYIDRSVFLTDPEDIEGTTFQRFRIYGIQDETRDIKGMHGTLACEYFLDFDAEVHERMRKSASE